MKRQKKLDGTRFNEPATILPSGTRRTAAAAAATTPVQRISKSGIRTLCTNTGQVLITSYNSIIPGISGPTVEVLGCEPTRLQTNKILVCEKNGTPLMAALAPRMPVTIEDVV